MISRSWDLTTVKKIDFKALFSFVLLKWCQIIVVLAAYLLIFFHFVRWDLENWM